jgi:hypothetical protein
MRVAHDTQWTHAGAIEELHFRATERPYVHAKAAANARAHPSGPEAENPHAAVIMSVLWNRWPPDSAHAKPPETE